MVAASRGKFASKSVIVGLGGVYVNQREKCQKKKKKTKGKKRKLRHFG